MGLSDLSLTWPGLLVLLALVPLLAAAYGWALRRRRRYALRFSSLALVRPALVRQRSLRRHLPPALYLLALASLVVALARPMALVNSRATNSTIILVMDVSGSMEFDDIAPSRLKAAKAAALSFIQLQKASTRIGIVVFSDEAQLILAPTTDHDKLNHAVSSLFTGDNTAIGSGIFTALQAIANDRPGEKREDTARSEALRKGEYAPESIVLLTDGYSTVGPPPLDAAKEAARQGIRVYTIGFGTRQGIAQQNAPSGKQKPGIPVTGGSGSFSLGVDEWTLKKVASLTGGRYYASNSAGELQNVFTGLSTILGRRSEVQEIGVAFIGLGALLCCVATLLSLLWHPHL